MFTISMSTMSNVLCTVYHVLWRGCVSLESEKGEKGEGKNVCRRDNGRTEIRGSLRGPREPKNEVKQDQGQKTLPIKGDDKGCCHREVNTASMQENYWRHRQALEQVIHRMCLRGIGGLLLLLVYHICSK